MIGTLRDFAIEVTQDDLLRAYRRRSARRENPALLAAASMAAALGSTLLQPAAVYAEMEVRDIISEDAVLARPYDGQVRLTIGPKADLLAPARKAIVAVCTIGPALERRVQELQAAGEPLLAFMLDSLGVIAVGAVSERVRELCEARAAEMGWGVGPALGPGSLVGWPVEGQRDLCSLLPIGEIGVRLTQQCVLLPFKSVSLLVGLGPGYEDAHVGSVCRFCSIADTCWRRRENGD